MKEFMSYLIIIAIIAFIAFICYMIIRRSNEKSNPVNPAPTPPKPGANPSGYPESYPDAGDEDTGIFTEWSVVQLDPDSGTPIKKQSLLVSEKGRFTIGRNKACNFVLKGAMAQDYVSRMHLGVGKDATGYFAKPLSRADGSIALTYVEGQLVMSSFDLVDKQVIWLGNIPIAFVRNVDRRKDLQFNPGSRRDETTFARDHEDTMTFAARRGTDQRGDGVFYR